MFALALGYEDLNDHDRLRRDALLSFSIISSKVMRGVHPSFSFALVGSPSRVSTSVGRK